MECAGCAVPAAGSKTHVPARCAGNHGNVRRFTVVRDDQHRATATKRRIGGVHFYGLCASCNSGVQSRYDPAYGELAEALWPIANAASLYLPPRLKTPPVEVRPGAIARSVLIGAFALNPQLRTIHPTGAEAILSEADSVSLPDNLSLSLALTRGPFARITGSIGGFYLFRPKVENKNIGIMSLAQIYFPPLAWQLANARESVLLKQQGWADVSNWLARSPHEALPLDDLVGDLPLVVHPTRARGGPDDWVELLSDEAAFIVEGENASPPQS